MKEEKKKSWFRILVRNSFLTIAYLFLALMILTYVSPRISPAITVVPAFLGLAFLPLFLLLVVFFLLLVIRGYRIHCFIFLPFLLYGCVFLFSYYRPSFGARNEALPGSFKIVSYNVRLFNLYSWKTNEKLKSQMFDFLVKENADIYCFQEYYYQKDGGFSTTQTLEKILPAKNVYQDFSIIHRNNFYYGIATFSRFPIVGKGRIYLPQTSNMCIYTDLLICGDTVRVYNNHLESVRLGYEDYKTLDNLDFEVEKGEMKKTVNIFRRLRRAFVKRAVQADLIAAHIAQCRYPVVVCGDFNDTPMSYAYHTVSKGLTSAFRESGKGTGRTYNGKIPMLPIDYIFHSDPFTASTFNIPSFGLSDHYPVECMLYLKK